MKTLIIDGNNLVHRVFWICKSKEQDNLTKDSLLHVYMFLNSIKKYTEMFLPDKIYMCWDEKPDKQQNIRHTLNSNYKANRSKDVALEVYSQTELIKELVESLGIKNLFPYQYEADDIMCYICINTPGDKVVVTVDNDLYQLVSNDVTVFNPIKKVSITPSNFEQVVGCSVFDFVMIKALKGDKSDNIDGLTGFGDKKIQKYLTGAVKLDEAQQAIVDQNLRIMNLSLGGVSNDVEVEYISNQLKLQPMQDFNKFLNLCRSSKFDNIVQNKDKWNELFFFKNAYTDLLVTLFN